MNGLERDLEGQAQVLRLSVGNDVAVAVAARYGVRALPTFVLLDGAGDHVLTQAGMPKREPIVEAVEKLGGP